MNFLDLPILLDDDCLLVINKPTGLPTQAPRQFDSVERRVREWLAAKHNDPRTYLGLPHRIDRAASGVLVLAKTPRELRQVSRQFERRQIRKSYWVCVESDVQPHDGLWEDYVRKLPSVPKVEIVAADSHLALHAVLRYRVIGSTQYGSWLEIELLTGRTHQIRVQSAAHGHPVLGDTLYGSLSKFGQQQLDERQRAIALHARSLTFRHPTTAATTIITAEPPTTWAELNRSSNAS